MVELRGVGGGGGRALAGSRLTVLDGAAATVVGSSLTEGDGAFRVAITADPAGCLLLARSHGRGIAAAAVRRVSASTRRADLDLAADAPIWPVRS